MNGDGVECVLEIVCGYGECGLKSERGVSEGKNRVTLATEGCF
jgi:hypothetical protein